MRKEVRDESWCSSWLIVELLIDVRASEDPRKEGKEQD